VVSATDPYGRTLGFIDFKNHLCAQLRVISTAPRNPFSTCLLGAVLIYIYIMCLSLTSALQRGWWSVNVLAAIIRGQTSPVPIEYEAA
jgi:hypothetical protein